MPGLGVRLTSCSQLWFCSCTLMSPVCTSMMFLLLLSGNFPMISDDLVNSYHLLLCALDLVFTNALLCNARKDLLNPEFKGGVLRLTYTSFLPLLTCCSRSV